MDSGTRDDTRAADRLAVALEALERAFGGEPDVGDAGGCSYCHSESDLALLGGDPARVPDSLVGSFGREGADHWDGEKYPALWRRFAPRLVRLVVKEGYAADPGMILRSLGPCGARFSQWPGQQRAAVLDALGCALDLALIDGRPADEVVDLLGAVSAIDEELAPWTARWNTLTGRYADAGLVRLACHWATELLWGEQPHWWWYPDDPIGLGTTWVCSRPVRERVSRFAATYPRCKTAHDAAAAIDRLASGGRPLWYYPTYQQEHARAIGLVLS